jgi:hypothetical protein
VDAVNGAILDIKPAGLVVILGILVAVSTIEKNTSVSDRNFMDLL